MTLFGTKMETLDDLFVHELKAIYYAERRITEALPQMIGMATSPDLRMGFEQHLRETENQLARLEQVFRMHNVIAEEGSCPAIDGIIKDNQAMASDITDKAVLDAALAGGAQKVEHHEIASYGTLIAWARELGREDCAAVLAETLAEEKATDEKLTQLAEARINARAEMATPA